MVVETLSILDFRLEILELQALRAPLKDLNFFIRFLALSFSEG